MTNPFTLLSKVVALERELERGLRPVLLPERIFSSCNTTSNSSSGAAGSANSCCAVSPQGCVSKVASKALLLLVPDSSDLLPKKLKKLLPPESPACVSKAFRRYQINQYTKFYQHSAFIFAIFQLTFKLPETVSSIYFPISMHRTKVKWIRGHGRWISCLGWNR